MRVRLVEGPLQGVISSVKWDGGVGILLVLEEEETADVGPRNVKVKVAGRVAVQAIREDNPPRSEELENVSSSS